MSKNEKKVWGITPGKNIVRLEVYLVWVGQRAEHSPFLNFLSCVEVICSLTANAENKNKISKSCYMVKTCITGVYLLFNNVRRLGSFDSLLRSCHSPWTGRQSVAWQLPSLLAGAHLKLSRLKQWEVMSIPCVDLNWGFQSQVQTLQSECSISYITCNWYKFVSI